MNRFLQGLALGVILIAVGIGAVWNSGFEARPGGTDLASDLDTFIQEFKAEVRKRMEVEHIFGPNTDDNGLHQVGSARCFVATSAPGAISGGVATSGPYTGSGNASTVLTTDEPGATTRQIGVGRCWVDTDGADGVVGTPDDYTLWVWSETGGVAGTGGWVQPSTAGGFRIGANLLTNGQFLATDGTGALAGVTAVPAGWTLVATNPTLAYTATDATEGSGVQVTMTRGAADGGIKQTLKLKQAAAYFVTARMKASGAGVCELKSVGAGGANMATKTTTSTSYVTLTGTLVSDPAAIDDLDIQASVITGAGTCSIGRIGIFEIDTTGAGINGPGSPTFAHSTSTTSSDLNYTALTAIPILGVSFTPPNPGWLVQVVANLSFNSPQVTQLVSAECGIYENNVAVGTLHGVNSYVNGAQNRAMTMVLNYTNRSPTPGTLLAYTVKCRGADNNGGASKIKINGTTDSGNVQGSDLDITAIPPR